ncbi:IS4 family transposase [Granulosicoccus antarcticus]|uniref:Transposase IS4-like domain-containing protein n=1 Tax=Granulosicoccus antarcticus IMCC3135 TaxID=1192854 RepID=A0A2Z2NKA5_9GAMM|nr:IS4 family transposase [Granulosicoccus antarcticus]ASJ70308.1 hypothetical protein IMCC3135_00910 [Granulosicoccus antarcticus IMCC3135]
MITDKRFFDTVESHLPAHRERTYPPTETLAMFVAQVLNDDSSCQRAVNDRIVRCLQHGLRPPGTSTAAYCEARSRLPSSMVEALFKTVGQKVSNNALPEWLWRGRSVYFIDGTGLSMPDTPDNQLAYPQPSSQQKGIGFPEARMVALSCAATGAIIDALIGPAKGKTTGELSQMRTLARSLKPGDVLVGDAIYETYWTFVMLQGIGCDGVFEINGSRSRPEKRRAHLTFKRPVRPEWMDAETYELCPREIRVRQVVSRRRGYQDTFFITSLTDQRLVSAKEIVALYLRRWNVETDFRSLKCALDAGILSCRSAEMIEKELWVHLLAYNLTRLLMSEAAAISNREPRSISFRHTVQLWSAWSQCGQQLDAQGWTYLLQAIAGPRVGNRPGRREPRAVKRRPKSRKLLDIPRSAARTCCHMYEQ